MQAGYETRDLKSSMRKTVGDTLRIPWGVGLRCFYQTHPPTHNYVEWVYYYSDGSNNFAVSKHVEAPVLWSRLTMPTLLLRTQSDTELLYF